MSINFDELPSSRSGNNSSSNGIPAGFEKGTYRCVIEAAEMRTSKDPLDENGNRKPDYLNIRYGVFADNGERITGIFDILSESPKELIQYKLKRFITALQLGISGTFELKDLCKILKGKALIAALHVREDKQYGDKIEVNIFHDTIYEPLAGASEPAAPAAAPPPADTDAPEFTPDLAMSTPEDEEIEY